VAVAVIVADDLTGAADACATFVTHGLTGAVTFGVGTFGMGAFGAGAAAEVIAVSTDSRTRSSALAAARVREVVRFAAASHAPALLFKKIDSTLRGHVGEEVSAAMEAARARIAIVAPAFPAMGRTVEHGLLRVRAAGAVAPRHVAGRLESHGVRNCRRIPRPASAIREGGDWRDRMIDAIRNGARALVCDSVDDDDLDGIVDAAWTLEGPILWVGSAGLADALARRLQKPAQAPASPGPGPGLGPRGSVIMWIGSHHPATNAQQHYLTHGAQGTPPVAVVSESEIDAAAECLDRGRHVLVDISRHSANDVVARMVASVIDRPLAGFVMSGGDTAARVCQMLDASCIELGGEVRRGIPWGWLRTRAGRHWPVVLKSGGFGGEDALHHAIACLSGEGSGGRFEGAGEEKGTRGSTDG
jgi:D-threonate/D-erythronate kinase